jgi:predicted O-methyltransferase YrrM
MNATMVPALDRSLSDKDWQHEYHLVYEDLFASCRNDAVSLLEIGVDNEYSMQAWTDYFAHPKAVFTGMAFHNKQIENFEKDGRIHIVHGDRRSETDLQKIGSSGPFNIIADVGPSDQQNTFARLWKSLIPGGVYIIEDIDLSLVNTFTKKVLEDVNSEFSTGEDNFQKTDVLSISFSRNLIAVKKRKRPEGNVHRRRYRRYRWRKYLQITQNTHPRKPRILRRRNKTHETQDVTFTGILKRSNSDKYWQHEYHLVYEDLFSHYVNDKVSLLEIGVDKGYSMKTWGDFFRHPQAVFRGMAYHNKNTGQKQSEKFDKDDRIHIINGDQSNDKDLQNVAAVGPFTIILDDGSHVPSHQKKTFAALWKSIIPGGAYIIEDIETSFWKKSTELYGYPFQHETSVFDTFFEMLKYFVKEEVSSQFSKGYENTDVLSISFSRNLIVLKKRNTTNHRKQKDGKKHR